MKNIIMSIIWALICAWLITRLLLYVDARIEFTQEYFFPSIIDFIHGIGFSARKVCFTLITLFFILTGIHKWFGQAILFVIGVVVILACVALAIFIASHIIGFMANTL